MKKLVLGTLLGGLITFSWGAFSWMVLPWHKATLRNFTNEHWVASAIRDNAPESGVYFLQQEPTTFATVRREAVNPTSRSFFVKGFFVELGGAFLLTLLLLALPELNYGRRVLVAALVSIIAAVTTHLPNWNWWGFSTGFTLVSMADQVIAWTLAGLAIAAITLRKSSPGTPV